MMLVGTLFVVLALLGPATAAAQNLALLQGSPAPQSDLPRHPAYDKLQMFVGNWTIEGREDKFRESCDWFDGRFHVVCHAESKRSDGTVGRSISILGYLPEEDAYTYHGIGSRGRNETMRGTFEGSTFRAEGESRNGGKRVKSRVTITPGEGGTFSFRSETSIEAGPWVDDGTIQYKTVR